MIDICWVINFWVAVINYIIRFCLMIFVWAIEGSYGCMDGELNEQYKNSEAPLWSKPSESKLWAIAASLMNAVALQLKENWMVLTWGWKKTGWLWVELGRSLHGWWAYFSTVSWLEPSERDENQRMGYLNSLLLRFSVFFILFGLRVA